MLSVYILAAVVSLLLFALCRAEIKKVQLARKTWDELIGELKPVRTEGITLAALECSNIDEWGPGIHTDELWTMIGEWDGLKQMEANSKLLVALASQAKAWNLGESTIVAERMQVDAEEMRQTAIRLRLGRLCGCGGKRVAVYVQVTASAYYRMSERLLTLYETSPSRRYGQLTAVVWHYTTAV